MKAYLNNFENLCLIGIILCIEQPIGDPKIQNIKICAPLSFFLKIVELAHQDSLFGHSGKDKTLSSIKRFFYWPGLCNWVFNLIANPLDCLKKNKTKTQGPKRSTTGEMDRNFLFHTVHIDHKGPINSPSNGKNIA